MGTAVERLLRLMVLQGKPIQSYGLSETAAADPTQRKPIRLDLKGRAWAVAA
jgi:hypothetical protein